MARAIGPKPKSRKPNRGRVPTKRKSARRGMHRPTSKRWSASVTRQSNALDLEPGVFTWDDPKAIAASLKRSAERSRRRKSEPYRSALSMLVFYINRAGSNLPGPRRRTLQQAKVELRKQFARR